LHVNMTERFGKFNDPRTDEIRKWGIDVTGPSDMLRNQEVFAQPVESSTEELVSGVRFEKSTQLLSENGEFTNRYRVIFSAENVAFAIDTKKTATHIQRQVINDESIVATINGGYFFLVDSATEEVPAEATFGTVVRDGVLYSAQSHDRPMLWVDLEGQIHAAEVSAKGRVSIGNSNLSWAGYRSIEKGAEVQLFGADSCVIEHVQDPETGKRRVMNQELSRTPQESTVVDVVCEEQGGQLCVVALREGGGTLVTEGSVILQGQRSFVSNVSLGDVVAITYDNLDLAGVKSAITIGPSVTHFDAETDHPINSDRSLGDHPPLADSRAARSIVYKTTNGDVAFEVFDGAPKTALFKGVAPKEVGDILRQDGIELEWAYFLDSGQSSRLAVRHADGSVEGFGNHHYIRWPNMPEHPYVWAGEHGRSAYSAVNAKIKNNDE
jgi:hypothetical protein